MSSGLRVFLVGVTRADLDGLRARATNDASLDIAGAALIDDIEHGMHRVPEDVDAVLMSPAALAYRPPPPLPVDVADEEGGLIESLTAREHDVLALVADGYGNREIGSRLGISEHTVKFHLASIFGKLGASTRTEAVRRGLKRGLIEI